MKTNSDLDLLIGKRIRLVSMTEDPDPVPSGSEGTIIGYFVFDANKYQLSIDWDTDVKRSLCLVCPPDVYEVLT